MKLPLRVIVCGGRDYADKEAVWRVLSEIDDTEGILAVAHGGATGADSEAAEWAARMRITTVAYKARWKQEGKAARPLRNQRMLDQFKPDAVVAFPGGRGTADMVRRARENGVRVIDAKTL
jgi:predicted Rossmann-fold nucleotide-binding protein